MHRQSMSCSSAVIDMSREDRMAFKRSRVDGRPIVKWPP
jgi:hypothetical protein